MATTEQNKVSYNTDFLKTTSGLLRICEAAAALAGLISGAIGSKCDTDGKIGFFLFVTITSMLEAILIIIVFVFRLDTKITFTNIPLTLFINDGVCLVFYFLSSLLVMLSIGQCYYMVTARVFASLFSIANFLVLVGLFYLDYVWWKGQQLDSKESNVANNGTTATESTPNVITLR